MGILADMLLTDSPSTHGMLLTRGRWVCLSRSRTGMKLIPLTEVLIISRTATLTSVTGTTAYHDGYASTWDVTNTT